MKSFYVYAIYEVVDTEGTELPIYVGKGHDDSETGYSRLSHYTGLKKHIISALVYDKIMVAIQEGRPWAVRKLMDADDQVHAFALERQFIAEFGREFLLNCTDGGCSGWTLRESSRRRMSEAHKGKKLGPLTAEQKLKLSIASRRRASDPKWRAAHSAALKGIPLTEEHCAKISQAHKGVPKSPEHCAAISAGKTGVKQSEEHRINNALARTGLKAGPYKTRCDKLPEAEAHARRLDTYRRSYEKRSEQILARKQAERDAARRAELGLGPDAPLPSRITHLTQFNEQQHEMWGKLLERFNYVRRVLSDSLQEDLASLRKTAEAAVENNWPDVFKECMDELDGMRENNPDSRGYRKPGEAAKVWFESATVEQRKWRRSLTVALSDARCKDDESDVARLEREMDAQLVTPNYQPPWIRDGARRDRSIFTPVERKRFNALKTAECRYQQAIAAGCGDEKVFRREETFYQALSMVQAEIETLWVAAESRQAESKQHSL